MAKDKLQTLADELEEVLDRKSEIEEELKTVKEYEDQVRSQILLGLQKKGYKFIKTTSGLGFGITLGRKTFAIKMGSEEVALKWAQENYPSLLTISNSKLGQVVKPMLNRPEFVEEKVGNSFLSVRASEDSSDE